MFSVLWKFPKGEGEEIFLAPAVSFIKGTKDPVALADGGHRDHVTFARKAAYGDGENGFERTVIDIGKVFVMNPEGQTVASYHFSD